MTTPLNFVAAHAAAICVTWALALVAFVLLRLRPVPDADPRAKLDAAEAREDTLAQVRAARRVPTWEETREMQRQFMEAWGELPKFEWQATREELKRWQAQDARRRPREMDDRDRLAMIRGGNNG